MGALDHHFLPPQISPSSDLPNREEWLKSASDGFASFSAKNKEYYRVILEILWPPAHGIPGPVLTEDEIRDAINKYRGIDYRDPFRRVRELQGEEGFYGIKKEGKRAQLQNLEVGQKRDPRIKLPRLVWEEVLDFYSHRCVNCGKPEILVTLEQDHKIPRARGGTNELENWQPLCTECNNIKSSSCSGCNLDCLLCAFAFPEKFSPIRIADDLIEKLRLNAKELRLSPSEYVNKLLRDSIVNNNQPIDI